MEVANARGRIDSQRGDLLGRFGGHRLDIDAALGRGDERDAPGPAIDQEREVKLARDGRVLDHIDMPHQPAFRPGLGRDERHAQNAVGFGMKLFERLHELDAAAFAAAAGMNLSLHDEGLAAEIAGVRSSLFGARRHLAVGYRRPVLLQQRLGLIFVDIHDNIAACRNSRLQI